MLGTLKDLQKNIFRLKQLGSTFKVIRRGGSCSLEINGIKKTYLTEKIPNRGMHLICMIKKNIKERLDQGLVTLPKDIDDNLKYKAIDLEAIDKSTSKMVTGIDINSCYFNTLYKLGYIDKKMYDYAMSKTEWKTGRNASIGSLARRTIVETYDRGEKVKQELFEESIEFQRVRKHVISHVWSVFEELQVKHPKISLMFITDCVFVNPEHVDLVRNFYTEHGYETKVKDYLILERNKNKINWTDRERIANMKNPSSCYFRYDEVLQL